MCISLCIIILNNSPFRSGSSSARILITVQDVASCSSQIKLGKSDCNHVIYTDHFVHWTNRLFVLLSLLFSSMVSHGFIPSDMNISTLCHDICLLCVIRALDCCSYLI